VCVCVCVCVCAPLDSPVGPATVALVCACEQQRDAKKKNERKYESKYLMCKLILIGFNI